MKDCENCKRAAEKIVKLQHELRARTREVKHQRACAAILKGRLERLRGVAT